MTELPSFVTNPGWRTYADATSIAAVQAVVMTLKPYIRPWLNALPITD